MQYRRAVDIEAIAHTAIPLQVIDLVRDPRDVLASIRSFTARGVDGFGRRDEQDELDYVNSSQPRSAPVSSGWPPRPSLSIV